MILLSWFQISFHFFYVVFPLPPLALPLLQGPCHPPPNLQSPARCRRYAQRVHPHWPRKVQELQGQDHPVLSVTTFFKALNMRVSKKASLSLTIWDLFFQFALIFWAQWLEDVGRSGSWQRETSFLLAVVRRKIIRKRPTISCCAKRSKHLEKKTAKERNKQEICMESVETSKHCMTVCAIYNLQGKAGSYKDSEIRLRFNLIVATHRSRFVFSKKNRKQNDRLLTRPHLSPAAKQP